jgi:indolepyruvate ferredoxin oxidoreductase
VHSLPASELATALLGDALFTNLFLLGYAFQLGKLPVSLGALERALELNARAVAANRRAFAWGRLAAHDRAAVERAAGLGEARLPAQAGSLESLVARRAEFLVGYQGHRLAQRYRRTVERVAEAERKLGDGREDLARAVARAFFKLLAYKDEYEVARLWTDGRFRAQLAAEFEGDYRVELHLAPPHMPILDRFLDRVDPDSGRTRKIAFGPWIFRFLRVLARLRFLRGTPFDLFGRTAHRRLERRLIAEYERTLAELLSGLAAGNRELAVEIASLPEQVRGFEDVKEHQLAHAQAREAQLLAAFRGSSAVPR